MDHPSSVDEVNHHSLSCKQALSEASTTDRPIDENGFFILNLRQGALNIEDAAKPEKLEYLKGFQPISDSDCKMKLQASPLIKIDSSLLLGTPWDERYTGEKKNTFKTPCTPRLHNKPFDFKTPVVSSWTVPLTPHLMNFCTSNSNATFSIDILSTPSLFPVRVDKNVPDLLHLIDSDRCPASALSSAIASFDTRQCEEESIVELVAEMEEDYNTGPFNLQSNCAQVYNRTYPYVQSLPKTSPPKRKARHSKRITDDLKSALKEQEKRKKKERKSKKNFEETSTAKSLRERVKRSGRRSRSAVRACKELGLAKTERELNMFFS